MKCLPERFNQELKLEVAARMIQDRLLKTVELINGVVNVNHSNSAGQCGQSWEMMACGDAILTYFDPLASSFDQTGLASITCAMEMQNQMAEFNKEMNDD